ncbi:MAG: phage holin family protein, partial [Thermoleophilaceae bacterium]
MADGTRLNDESASELVRKLADQTSTLVRQELAIARAELSEKVKFWGLGGGLFGVAALLALFALIVLIATAILALAEAVAPWLAALIVAVVLLLIAGVLGLVGKQQVE